MSPGVLQLLDFKLACVTRSQAPAWERTRAKLQLGVKNAANAIRQSAKRSFEDERFQAGAWEREFRAG